MPQRARAWQLHHMWCRPCPRRCMPETLQVVVVVNKVDRPAARPDWVVDQTFELFLDLGATDEQCGKGS